MSKHRYWTALSRVPAGVYRHGALGYAKGAAYSALLSFFPVFTVITAVLVRADAPMVARRVASLLYEFSPPEVEQLLRAWVTEQGLHRSSLHAAAVLLSLWAASGVITSLMDAFQAAYEKPSARGAVHQLAVQMALVVLALAPAVGATILMFLGDQIEDNILRGMGLLGQEQQIIRPGVHLIGKTIRYCVALVSVGSVTVMLYRFGPDVKGRRRLLPGALLSTVLWLALTQVLAWYLREVANYNVLYGSLGAVMAFLFWMYLLALVAMIGCEYNAALDRQSATK